MKLRLACSSDKEELINLWKVCFNDTNEAINLFFNLRFKCKDCIVCEMDSKIVSALYMMDAYLNVKCLILPAFYIYAAGTLPEYRGRGCMKNLISYANSLQIQRMKKCSILLPADDSLYNYYNKFGYEKFFKSCILSLSNEQLKKYVVDDACIENDINYDEIYNLRFELCKNSVGNVIWDKKAIKYAFEFNKIYGGKTIFVENGYAICNRNNDDLEIVEFFVARKSFNKLMTLIYNEFPECKKYNFRYANVVDYFSYNPNIKDFGMIKVLDAKSRDILEDSIYPYLGLTLD